VLAVLNLETLELSKDSFVDEALQEHYSDLLYRLACKDGHPAYVYVLLEHKSYSDRWTGFQLLRYMVRIWEQEHKQGSLEDLPPIISLVLYHGEFACSAAEDFRALVAAPDALRLFVPDFRYRVCDLSRGEVQRIKGQHPRGGAVAIQIHPER